MAINDSEKWATYEANTQSYRSIFHSSQSFLLAVGALLLDKSDTLLFITCTIALFNIWYIWSRVIIIRTRIVDYHKFSLGDRFDKDGNETNDSIKDNKLDESVYARDKTIRNKVNEQVSGMGEIWNRKEKFKNMRLSRIKIDILIPATYTLVWLGFILYRMRIII